LVDIPNFIQATRDSGYRNTAATFADFVDNSLEAGANRIDIELRAEVDGEITIEFLDNGCGMAPSQLLGLDPKANYALGNIEGKAAEEHRQRPLASGG
jgi:Histidine kinase-, DNA gyrase B-, and HSP90-like ATPase